MKIISHGKYYDGILTEICYNCGCNFSYKLHDIDRYQNSIDKYNKILGKYVNTYSYYVTCPDCDIDIEVSEFDYDMLKKFDDKKIENKNGIYAHGEKIGDLTKKDEELLDMLFNRIL